MLVSTPKPAGPNDDSYPYAGEVFSRTTLRRVEVPYKRQVKVPTKLQKVVDTTVRKIVPVKRLVEVEEQRPVEEEYTVLTDPTLPPNADPQMVAEARANIHRATLKVPVTRKRTVMKTFRVIREVDDYAEVEVPANRVVEVDGYRVDEVEDTKVVEVEEVQQYMLQPVPISDPTIQSQREIGRIQGTRLYRNTGDTYLANDPIVEQVEDDDMPWVSRTHHAEDTAAANAAITRNTTSTASMTSRGLASTYNTTYNSTFSRPTSSSASALARTRPGSSAGDVPGTTSFYRQHRQPGVITPVPAYGQYDRTGYTDPRGILPAGSYKKRTTAAGMILPEVQRVPGGGFSVKPTHTAHTDGHGVAVASVEPVGKALSAGLRAGDVITHVDGAYVGSVEELMKVYAAGSVLHVNRDGRRGVAIRV